MLPKVQASFWPNSHTADQVALLTEDTEASFDRNLKAGVVLVNLWAAYDTVWHCGLTLKLLKTIPSKEMVRVTMGMILQHHFHVHIRKSKSHCQTLLNGVLQGPVIVLALFNLYIYDAPTTVSRKYIYVNDIAMMPGDKCLTVVEQTLSDNLGKLRIIFATGT